MRLDGVHRKVRRSSRLGNDDVCFAGSVTRLISICCGSKGAAESACARRQRYAPKASQSPVLNSPNRVKYLAQRGLAKSTRKLSDTRNKGVGRRSFKFAVEPSACVTVIPYVR